MPQITQTAVLSAQTALCKRVFPCRAVFNLVVAGVRGSGTAVFFLPWTSTIFHCHYRLMCDVSGLIKVAGMRPFSC